MNWSTGLELDFIKKLGTISERKGHVSRADLLRGYIECCGERKYWNNVNRAEVVEFAKQELARENQ